MLSQSHRGNEDGRIIYTLSAISEKKKWKKSFSQTLTSTKVQNKYFRFIRDI